MFGGTMKINSEGEVRLSASDIAGHLGCQHLTALDLSVTFRQKAAPPLRAPDLWILQELGLRHETAYLEFLSNSGLSVVRPGAAKKDFDETLTHTETLHAMRAGTDVIVQAVLRSGRWFGRADVLRRVERPSKLGAWSYEIYDCKLARDTRASTILQLSLYSELLATMQGLAPEWMHVVPRTDDFAFESWRVTDFAAYYRYVKGKLEAACERYTGEPTAVPEPNPHCDICRWNQECEDLWRRVDHLSMVAGINSLQRKQLAIWGTTTVAALAEFPLPIREKPIHGSKDGYVRVREQARMQVTGRTEHRDVYELLEITEGRGLTRLPESCAGDVFFDLESDPFVAPNGREYLFGFAGEDHTGEIVYQSRWAVSAGDEKQAFEWFVDVIMERWTRHPTMHVYHFTAYEPSALERLMGRYATREDQIDRMLRAGLFVDLHTIVKQTLRASVEQYSLKALESFHHFERRLPLEDARRAMRAAEHVLELGSSTEIGEEIKQTIGLYNADDCVSTLSLLKWLERERAAIEAGGVVVSRPALLDGIPPESVDERQQRVLQLSERLREGISLEASDRSPSEAGRWLLANLLDWHRREDKADFWEYFRLRDLTDEDLLDERAALGGLLHVQRLRVEKKIPVDRYVFEKQDTDIRAAKTVCHGAEKIGEVLDINIGARTVDIKKTRKAADIHPAAVFADNRGPLSTVLADSLLRLGEWVATNGIDSEGPHRAARDLVLGAIPRLSGQSRDLLLPNESALDAAKRLSLSLDNSVLAIQGPPGAGKTYTGARMICELARKGRKVGITAGSHKVIRNLIDEVLKTLKQEDIAGVQCLQKVSDIPDEELPGGLSLTTSNEESLHALQNGAAQVVAGTPWLWSREEFFQSIDVLFVDEAGQMSLANTLAVSQSARSVVMLGDPQQLEQPSRGSHPDGADRSALEHLLSGAKTIQSDRGLFLDKTWRLNPAISAFTSEVFYEGRLQSHEGLDQQRIEGHPTFEQGLWFIPVEHEGNRNSSPEEVLTVAEIVDGLLQPGVRWTDQDGKNEPLQPADILVVAAYNAQVSDLATRLPGLRVGTVDKFQGQSAAVVIYSMASSSPQDAPRGMEFLYSLNRFNVATSRARALVIVVSHPSLLRPDCRSPRQMQLANALCRYAELAQKPSVLVREATSAFE
jgi:predicted RecB family nuclease